MEINCAVREPAEKMLATVLVQSPGPCRQGRRLLAKLGVKAMAEVRTGFLGSRIFSRSAGCGRLRSLPESFCWLHCRWQWHWPQTLWRRAQKLSLGKPQ